MIIDKNKGFIATFKLKLEGWRGELKFIPRSECGLKNDPSPSINFPYLHHFYGKKE